MNEILQQLQALLESAARQANVDASEYNDLVDAYREKETALALQASVREADQRQIKSLQEQLDAAKNEAESYRSQLIKDQRRLLALEDALASATNTLAKLKQDSINKNAASNLLISDLKKQIATGDPKTIALVKRLKAEKAELQEDVKTQRNTITSLNGRLVTEKKRREDAELLAAQSTMYTVKATEQGMLMYFPKQVLSKVEGETMAVQRSLLFIHRDTGRGGLITLDHDGQPIMGKTPRGGVKVEAELEEFAGAWLRKVKAQGNTVLPEDFQSLGG